MPVALTVIGKYQVVDRLGTGGMGTVYLARDPALDRLVAIKILSGDFDNEDLRDRFWREARSISRLRHPNIVTIFEFGDFTGKPFIAMEYVSGESWAELIRRHAPVPLFRKLRMMEELCAGMAYAHRARIVHRDIKPGNIMVDAEGGLIKILDFGIARSLGSKTTSTQVTGTPSYMSPEQTSGQRVDHRSDVFAVGSVFYELLSYRQAFDGETQVTIIEQILHGQPRPLGELCPGIDPKIVKIVGTAMEKDPGTRYQDLEAMRAAIQAVRERVHGSSVQPTIVMAPSAPAITPATPRRPDQLEKRRAIQVKLHADAAQQAFATGEYEAVLEACEQVRLLDATHALALDLMDRARVAMEDRAIEVYIRDARKHFERNALTTAEQLVSEALKLRGTFPLAVALQRELQQARREQERAQERAVSAQAALDRARANLADGALESAVRAASEALAHDPALSEAQSLKDRAATALAERRRKEEIERRALEVIDVARQEFNAGHPTEALKLLAAFSPPHPLVTQALADLRHERDAVEQRRLEEQRRQREEAERQRQNLERQARQRRIELLLGQARQQIDAGQLEAVGTTLHEIETIDSAVPQLQELLREVEAARLAAEAAAARRRAVDAKLVTTRQFLAANSYDSALEQVDEALRLDDQRPEARALRAQIRSTLEERRRIEEIDRRAQATVDHAHRLFAQGQHDDALSVLEQFRPRHPTITAATGPLRTAADEAARRRHEEEQREREVADRRAHQQWLDERKRSARLAVEERRLETAFDILEDIRRRDPQATGLAEIQAAADSARLAVLAAEQRRLEIGQKIGDAASLLERGDVSGASALIDSVLRLEPRELKAQALRVRILAEVEEERLRAQRTHEFEHQRRQALEQESEAAARLQAIAQARGSIEAHLSAGRLDEAEQALVDAERLFGAADLHQIRQRLSTVRSLQKRDADPARPSEQHGRTRVWVVGLIVAGIFLFAVIRSGFIGGPPPGLRELSPKSVASRPPTAAPVLPPPPSKSEAPKVEPTPGVTQPPKSEAPKGEPSSVAPQPPKSEAPKGEPSSVAPQPPKSEAPKGEPSPVLPSPPTPEPPKVEPAPVAPAPPTSSQPAREPVPNPTIIEPPRTATGGRSSEPLPSANPTSAPTVVNQEAAVHQVLERYRNGMESMNVKAVTDVYPSMDARGLARAFNDLRSQKYNVEKEDIVMALDLRTATANWTVTVTFDATGGKKRESLREVFKLRKDGDSWLIQEMKAAR